MSMKFESKKTTSLESKLKLAKDRGYTFSAEENFHTKAQILLREEATGFEYYVYWDNFARGIKPSKTTLESKIAYADSRGYTLQREVNFTVKESVALISKNNGLEYRVLWDHFVKGASPTILTLAGKKQLTARRGYTLVTDTDVASQDTVIVRNEHAEYEVEWGTFSRGGAPKYTTLEHKKKETEARGYTLLETENFSTNSRARVRSNTTGREYKVWYTNFIYRGYQEGNSKGEIITYYLLSTNLREDLSFEYQYRVDYSEEKKGFFDFCVRDRNNNILVFIEYNGIQHYEPTFGEKAFELTLLSDKLKREYAERLSIPLLVVPYTYETKEDIVSFIRAELPTYFVDDYVEFTPKWASISPTTLDDKRALANSVGYTIHPDVEYNFTHQDTIVVVNQDTSEEWAVKWGHFVKCVVPQQGKHKRVTKLSLEEKKEIAAYVGYQLLEDQNFPVINKVRLLDKEGKEITRIWRTIHKQYKQMKERGE